MITGRTTSGSDRITGTRAAERLTGGMGNDTLIGGGGADTLVGDAGDDRLIARAASGTTGLRGGNGNDFLSATVRSGGQVHMFGMDGDDTLEMDLSKDASRFSGGEQIGYMGHHVYGGTGADTFSFINAANARGTIIGRIDDFNASQDRLMLEGRVLNLERLPDAVKIFEFKEQQWLKIGANAFYALEGARSGGAERHFLDNADLQAMKIASTGAQNAFVDQANEVPSGLFSSIANAFRAVGFGGSSQENFVGTDGNDLVNDTRVRSASVSNDATDNRFNGGGGDDVINAGKGDDTIYGGTGDDSLAGGMDRDLIYGQSGKDNIYGGSEDDRIFGGLNDDLLEGGSGNDILRGEAGNDVLRGNTGRDVLYGGDGNDRMGGGDNGDRLLGGAGHDKLYGGGGRDLLRGGSGRDTLWGGDGEDKINGGSWSDRLHGQDGNDVLIGGQGDDTLRGDAGRDWISGGAGGDKLFGGSGADEFVFHPAHMRDWDTLSGSAAQRMKQFDRIEDFEFGVDQITLAGFDYTKGVDGLSGGEVLMEGARYAMVIVNESNHRLMVQLDPGESFTALRSADHFDFV